jgi:hypothetical protein
MGLCTMNTKKTTFQKKETSVENLIEMLHKPLKTGIPQRNYLKKRKALMNNSTLPQSSTLSLSFSFFSLLTYRCNVFQSRFQGRHEGILCHHLEERRSIRIRLIETCNKHCCLLPLSSKKKKKKANFFLTSASISHSSCHLRISP